MHREVHLPVLYKFFILNFFLIVSLCLFFFLHLQISFDYLDPYGWRIIC